MKKIVVWFSLLCMLIGLCACGTGESNQTEAPDVVTTETPTEMTPEAPTELPIVYTPLKLGETIAIEGICEFSIDEINWTKELRVRHPDSIHIVKEAYDGNMVMYLKLKYTNKSKNTFDYIQFWDWKAQAIYDTEYSYECGAIDGPFSTNRGVDPLITSDLYIAFELPEFMEDDDKPIEVRFAVEGRYFSLQVRG